MKSSTRLDSAVFQLTPTRTRCDLVITANGRTEKIASGLVNPFLAHLKAAQDQMAKGGYSLILEPDPGKIDSSWFTKGTVERFVRFVSTPEILERVYTLEFEIQQIEEAIAFQSNNDVGLEMVEDHQVKTPERIEGSKPMQDTNDKAIVLYKPGENPAEANGSTARKESSKFQLMKVLETRKSVLQKEQGMAFARAVAAGFDIDHMPSLMSFAESFGASRLLDACLKFKDLWKRKHETGQWVEIEGAEATSTMNASGVVLSNSVNKQWPNTPDSNGKTAAESSADEKSPILDQQASVSNQEYYQGQFPHPMYPPWPIQSPPGTMPVFPGYPMQFPYYPGNGPFFSPPFPSDAGQRNGLRRQSMDSGEAENGELGENQETGRNSSRSSKKKVVIRNINYITSKRQESSGTESRSASGSETDDEDRHKNSRRFSRKKKVNNELVLYNEERTNSDEADGRNWEAFQSYLLEGADDNEKDVQGKRSQQRAGFDDPLLLEGRGAYNNEDGNMADMSRIRGNLARMKRASNDDFMMHRESNGSDYASTADPVAVNAFMHPRKGFGKNYVDDDSYVVSMRKTTSIDHRVGADLRSTIDIDTEIPSSRAASQVKYEPDDVSLIPERGLDKGLVGYDPALDYEAENVVPLDKKNNKAATSARQGSKKLDKNSKSRLFPDASDKKKTVGPIRKGKPSKSSPLEEARARAEKLRNYKADLQKMKKEKEEQEIKRLEALKLERQKRISSRGGSIPAMPTRKQLPAKLSPSPHKSSKFSDSETGSMSPLQRSKPRKLSSTIHSVGNRLSRSASSLPEPKKENSVITPDAKASMARIRRLSEPKISSSNNPVTSLKPRKSEPVLKPKVVSSASEIKKLSVIVNYDKNKIASLPELKIRTAKRSDVANGKSAAKELPQNVNVSQSNTKGAELKRNGDKSSQPSNGDDNPIIDKKVLIQENSGGMGPGTNYEVEENTDTVSNYAAIQADVTDMVSCENRGQVLPDAYKGTTEIASTAEKELPKKQYEAPFARTSLMEDSCSSNSEYGKGPPSSLQKTTLRAHVSDPSVFKLEKIPEVLEKPRTKEPSKGFRRLLKFGKKKHSFSESDNVSIDVSEADDGAANIASSSEVNTLRNLISRDETPSANTTPQKTSRRFSLLSPFRSKTSEKRPSA